MEVTNILQGCMGDWIQYPIVQSRETLENYSQWWNVFASFNFVIFALKRIWKSLSYGMEVTNIL